MFKTSFHGGPELAATLRSLPAAYSVALLRRVLRLGAEPMRQRMGQLAPREPGAPDLADNMVISVAARIGSTAGGRWRPVEDSHEQAMAVGPAKRVGDVFLFYGLMQEYGTVYHGAQPFMRPAFDGGAQQSLGIIGRELWAALRAKIPPTSASGGRFL